MDWELADVVLLHVASVHDRDRDGPGATTVAAISEALGYDDGGMSNSVQLLSVITTLTDRGLVTERVRTEDERRVYEPTEAGRERADRFERELADTTVTVDDGTESRTVPANDVGAVADGFTREACLARLVDGSVLYLSRGDARLVGREQAFDRLVDAFDTPGETTVLVRGPVGIGKTALVDSFVEAVAGDATTLVGECDPTVGEPYGPVKAALGAAAPESADDVRSTLTDAGTVEDPEVVAARAAEFRERLVDVLESRAGDGSLVLVVEDLQWADTETLSFLEHLVETDVASAVVGTYRPGALGESHAVRSLRDRADATVDLDPLDRGETAALVSETVGLDAVPGSFVDRVYDHTGGNPLFAEETLAQFSTAGILDSGTSDSDLEFPSAVEEAVRQSLDALDDTGYEVLECAALAGRTVPQSILETVVDAPPAVVDEYVSLFVDGRYLERDGDVVVFDNERTRTVLQSAVDDDRRRAVHADLASAFEGVLDAGDVSHDQVAYHYERAGDPTTAHEHFVAAGERAVDVYAHETAVERYASAMRAAREIGDEDALLAAVEEKGRAHLAQGEYDAAEQAFEYVRNRASDVERERLAAYYRSGIVGERDGYEASLGLVEDALAEGPDTTEAGARLVGQRGWAEMSLGNYETAVESFERMLAVADELDDDRLRAQAHDHLGVTYYRMEQSARATEHCERAVELVEPLDDVFTLGKYLNHLSMTIEDRERSAEVYERALEAHREAGDVVTECDTLTNLGFLESKEDPAASLEYFERSADRAERIGYTQGVGAGNLNAGTVQIPLGELAEARDRLTTSRDVHDQLGRVFFLHGDYDGIATVDVLRDDPGSAHEFATHGLEIAEDVGRAIDRVDSLITLGDVARARDGPPAGRDAHERALDLAREDGDERSLLFAHLALAGDDLCVGEYGSALDHAEEAMAYAEAESDRRRTASAAYRRGVALRGLGDVDAAIDALDRAVDVARDRRLRLVECAARFERARATERSETPPGRTGIDPETDRERARELVESTGAVRLGGLAERDDVAAPTSV